ncbi:hypothetical protein FOZ60_001874 [Perkinsus olseni]|uniref:Uncharacterized protein n=1 Tax=Perkinsus olseni TaxID=32597 RepID=A0A7J6PJU7_PEROL|nr:hypothetical protein FOZ60_001874 [Perkinsus olseni]
MSATSPTSSSSLVGGHDMLEGRRTGSIDSSSCSAATQGDMERRPSRRLTKYRLWHFDEMRGSSDPDTEQGHQMVSPLLFYFGGAVDIGFTSTCTLVAAGLDLNFREKSLSSIISTIGLAAVLALNAGVDSFGSDRAAIHHYNHEFSRERWEHDIAPEHEVEEYVNYATNIGVPAADAEKIALMMVQHQQLSIPHHLVFELGLLRPCCYHQPQYFAASRMAGIMIGFLSAVGLASIFPKGSHLDLGIMWACGSLVLPILRYRHLWNLPQFKRFVLTQSVYFASVLLLARRLPYCPAQDQHE